MNPFTYGFTYGFTYVKSHVEIVVQHIELLINELSGTTVSSSSSTLSSKTYDFPINGVPDLPSSDFHSEVNDVLSGLLKDSSGPKNPTEEITAFISAIDFKEDGYWIYSILGIHVILLLLVFKFRKNVNLLATLFVIMAVPLRLSYQINDNLSPIYSTFASQNYFTKDGIFLSLLFSLPLLLLCCLVVCFLVYEAGKLLILVKKLEFGAKAKAINNENNRNKKKKQ